MRDHRRFARVPRRTALAVALTACVCLGAIVTAAALMPRVEAGESGQVPAQYGSAIFHQEFAVYFVIGLIAFLLGVAVTLLAVYLKKHRDGGDGRP